MLKMYTFVIIMSITTIYLMEDVRKERDDNNPLVQ